MICPRESQPWWSAIHTPMNTAIATAPSAAMRWSAGCDQLSDRLLNGLGAGLGRRRRQGRVRDEGEEPRDVEIEPVCQHELKAEQQHAGQCGELQRRLSLRHVREREDGNDEQRLEEALQDVQVRESARVVLAPVPDRERRLALDLPGDRPLREDAE